MGDAFRVSALCQSRRGVDLATRAAEKALADAGLGAADIPLIICSTSTPHRMTSTLSAAVSAAIGAQAACFDVRTGCSGGLFALTTAGLYLASGTSHALVIGAETFSKVIPKESKIAAVSLGDGAAAVVLSRGEGCIASAALMTDGTLGGLITTDGALPPTESEIARGGYVLSGAPETLAAVVPDKYAEAISAARERAGAGEISLFVPHQTSLPLIRAVAGRAGIDEAKTFVNVHRHANVGAAGVLGALVEARAEGRMNGRVLCTAVGGGMSWAAVVIDC